MRTGLSMTSSCSCGACSVAIRRAESVGHSGRSPAEPHNGVKNLLVVSPHFPPTSAADMHRVRHSLPYFEEFGWRPTVLAVKPDFVEACEEPLLLKTVCSDAHVRRVKALPAAVTRKVGLGDVGLRSVPFLYCAGAQLIRKNRFSLAYFSTTAFTAIPLGRIWKEQFDLPFVVDMQDPWLSDYYEDKQCDARPRKYWFSQRLHRALEPWTMKAVDGLVSVSPDYLTTLRERYPWLVDKPQTVLPFGASDRDFDVVRCHPQPNNFFRKTPAHIHGVYVGRGGKDMTFALQIIFQALKLGIQTGPEIFRRVRLHFVGTDYAVGMRARHTIAPVADSLGVSSLVEEVPERVPYFEALQLLRDADFLIVPGSDDAQYTASKIYPYILARKPLLAVFNRRSTVCQVLEQTRAGMLLQFDCGRSPSEYTSLFFRLWAELLQQLPFDPHVDWNAFEPYTARELTKAQCGLFNRVVSGR
jgi:hypothetical protein